jgi:hypothetical protein
MTKIFIRSISILATGIAVAWITCAAIIFQYVV